MSATLTAATYAALNTDLGELSTDGVGSYTIDLTSTTLTAGTLPFTVVLAAGSNLSIIGDSGGTVISGTVGDRYQTSQAVLSGSVTFVDVEINGFLIRGDNGGVGVTGLIPRSGGAGGAGGGGGAALGGGLFVGAGASVTLDQSDVLGDTAIGGNGGGGGNPFFTNTAAGAAGTTSSKNGQYGGVGYAGGYGGYGSNGSTISSGGTGGAGGAAGAYLKAPFLRGFPGGAGGAGGAGANGAFGAGGAGGGSAGSGGGAGYKGLLGIAEQNGGAGGNGGNGGAGGFGGGGGGGGFYGVGGKGLKNGAQGSVGLPGIGGFGGGAGTAAVFAAGQPYNGYGGGGLGAGGGVFVQQGGTLAIVGGVVALNTVQGGTGTGPTARVSGSGQALGSGIFLQGNQTLTLDPGIGQSVDITDVIADQTGSGGTGTNAGAGAILVAGGGSVTLAAANTFSGGVTITGGVLRIATAGNIGSGPVTFAGGGELLMTGTTSLSTPIGGFANGGTLEFSALAFVPGATAALSGTTLTVQSGEHAATADVTGLATGTHFKVVIDPATSGSVVTLACFAAGTRLLTAAGEVPVEKLRVGDHLPTLVGQRLARIRWIGSRDAANTRAVRVAAGAFGAGLPARDLVVSPDHALWIGGALVPARALAGRRGIQTEAVSKIRYYHIETAMHDVILADGLPAETYLDIGNRAAFIDGARPAPALVAMARREARACSSLHLQAAGMHMTRL